MDRTRVRSREMDRRSPTERAVDELMRPSVREDHFPKEGEDEIAAWVAPIEDAVDVLKDALDLYAGAGSDLADAMNSLDDVILDLRDDGESVPTKVTMLAKKIRRCLEEANRYRKQLEYFISDA